MRKLKVNAVLMLVSMMVFMTTSCIKEKENEVNKQLLKEQHTATAKRLSGNHLKATNYAGNYLLSAKAGHSASNCSGCIMVGGIRKHLDCQGYGSTCTLKSTVAISKVEPNNSNCNEYKGIGINDYEPTDEDIYNMPSRSFYFEDNSYINGYIWINIPEQILERDPESNQFTYYKISFTEEALYKNL